MELPKNIYLHGWLTILFHHPPDEKLGYIKKISYLCTPFEANTLLN